MPVINFEKYEARADIIKAMAHPSRLIIIDQLSKEEKCVGDLTELIGCDTSTVSKHLNILKKAGLVSSDKRGLNVYYRLKTPCILNFFGCVEDVLKSGIKSQQIALRK